MNIPMRIITIDIITLFVIFSDKNNNESKGTKTYPNDSKIGMSLRSTPFFSPKILINIEQKRIP